MSPINNRAGLARPILTAPPIVAMVGTWMVFTISSGSPFSAAESLSSGYRGSFGAFHWIILLTLVTYVLSFVVVYPTLSVIRRSRSSLTLRDFLMANLAAAGIIAGSVVGLWFAMGAFSGWTLAEVILKGFLPAIAAGAVYGVVCGLLMFGLATSRISNGANGRKAVSSE